MGIYRYGPSNNLAHTLEKARPYVGDLLIQSGYLVEYVYPLLLVEISVSKANINHCVLVQSFRDLTTIQFHLSNPQTVQP